jgi:hypothetical protein
MTTLSENERMAESPARTMARFADLSVIRAIRIVTVSQHGRAPPAPVARRPAALALENFPTCFLNPDIPGLFFA